MMQETVKDGGREGIVVVEDFAPFFEDAIRSDDGGAALIALTDDLEQEISTDFIDGEVAELIKDQDLGSKELTEVLLESSGGLRSGQGVDDVYSAGEEDGVTLLAGSDAERGGKMGFSQANATDQDHVGASVDELESKQMLDLEPIDFTGPGPVELIEGFTDGEARES